MKNAMQLSVFLSVFLLAPILWANEFVVVKQDTKFFPTVDSRKPFVHSKTKKQFLTLQLLETKGKRVRVKVTKEQGTQCYSSASFQRFELELWVDKRSLENVTTEPISWTYKDGSEVEIAAGLVVKSGKVITETSSLRLKVPKEKIGKSFKKKYLTFAKPKSSPESLTSKRGLKYNSNKYFKKSNFDKLEKVGDQHEFKNQCLRVRGKIKGKKPKETYLLGRVVGGGGAGDVLASNNKNVLFINAGAKLYTEKGEHIGKTAQRFRLLRKYFNSGNLVCHNIYDLGALIELCVKKSDTVLDVLSSGRSKDRSRRNRMRGRIEFGKIKVRGAQRAMVEKTFRTKANAFKYCYQRELQRNPKIDGTLSIQAKIGSDGKVSSSAVINSTLESEVVELCLLRVTKRLRFKASTAETTVNYPFKFSFIKK